MEIFNHSQWKLNQVGPFRQKKNKDRSKFGEWGLSLFLLILLFSLTTNPSALGADVPLYGVYETTIDYKILKGVAHSYADPFYGIELQTTFTSSSGKQITWWGFYDGDGIGGQSGNIWKIRFMPNELGPWTFSWRFSDGSLSGSGTFQAVDTAQMPKKPGPLQHDSTIHQWLVTADQSRHIFLNMYENDYAYPTKKVSYEHFLNPTPYINDLKANGFDVISTPGGIAVDNMPLDGNSPYPYTDFTNFIPRMVGWHLMENGLWKELYEQEVYYFEFWGFYGGNQFVNLDKKSKAFQNKVLRYWILRTAPYYIFLYNIGFELEEYVSVPSWPEDRAQFIKSLDPWDHLITGHQLQRPLSQPYSYAESNVMDFTAFQQDDGFHERALSAWNSINQPHVHCNECIWNAKWQGSGTEQSHRKDIWDGLTAGMSYGFYVKDSLIGLTAFRHANNFLKSGVKWWTMSPHDEIVTSGRAYALANLGKEYVVYSSSGATFNLSLPSGPYQYRWYNPGNGTFSALVTMNASIVNKFSKPARNDWVLHLTKKSVDTIATAQPQNLGD